MFSIVCHSYLVYLVCFGRHGEDAEVYNNSGVIFFLFFMTGLAIIIYLNQTPRTTAWTRLFVCRLFLRLCYMVWTRSSSHLRPIKEAKAVWNSRCSHCINSIYHRTNTDGIADLGRSRSLKSIHLSRLWTELPELYAGKRLSNCIHQWRQRHLPTMV